MTFPAVAEDGGENDLRLAGRAVQFPRPVLNDADTAVVADEMCVCETVAYGTGRDNAMHQHGRRTARQPLLLNLAWASALLLFPLGYIMSYPVVLRYGAAGPVAHTPGYQPVEWLLDETPLWHPMYSWSKICGSDEEVLAGSVLREIGDLRSVMDP